MKIAPAYGKPVVHVQDASRAVGVVASLKNPALCRSFLEENRSEQEKIRERYRGPQTASLLSLEDAREQHLRQRPGDRAVARGGTALGRGNVGHG